MLFRAPSKGKLIVQYPTQAVLRLVSSALDAAITAGLCFAID
jgi:hypothetical protein